MTSRAQRTDLERCRDADDPIFPARTCELSIAASLVRLGKKYHAYEEEAAYFHPTYPQ